MKNYILVFTFSIFLIIVIGEVAFLFFGNTLKQPASSIDKLVNQTTSASEKNQSQSQTLDGNSLSFLSANLEHWKDIQRGALTSSVITDQYDGTITEIDNREGIIPSRSGGVINYKIKIIIKTQNLSEVFFYLNDSDLTRTVVFASKSGEEKLINLKDLKIGDIVEIKYTIDLTKSLQASIKEIKIIKK